MSLLLYILHYNIVQQKLLYRMSNTVHYDTFQPFHNIDLVYLYKHPQNNLHRVTIKYLISLNYLNNPLQLSYNHLIFQLLGLLTQFEISLLN